MTTIPVVPLGRSPRSRDSRPRAVAAALKRSATAAPASTIRRTNVRLAGLGNAPASWLAMPRRRRQDTRASRSRPHDRLRSSRTPAVDERLLELRPNPGGEGRRLLHLRHAHRPREDACGAGEIGVAPLVELLGDELEGATLVARAVGSHGLLEQRERLLERSERRKRARVRARAPARGPGAATRRTRARPPQRGASTLPPSSRTTATLGDTRYDTPGA